MSGRQNNFPSVAGAASKTEACWCMPFRSIRLVCSILFQGCMCVVKRNLACINNPAHLPNTLNT